VEFGGTVKIIAILVKFIMSVSVYIASHGQATRPPAVNKFVSCGRNHSSFSGEPDNGHCEKRHLMYF
jgi:hypothetical protein